jgi:hypothetical protein
MNIWPPLSPGFWTAEPQLTRQRGPELCSDRYVLLSAVNKKFVNDGARFAQPPGSRGPSLSPTWIPRGLRTVLRFSGSSVVLLRLFLGLLSHC